MRYLLALLAVLLLPLAGLAQPLRPSQADVSYGSDPQQTLDLFQPSTPGPHRLVVFVHGGGWTAGSKRIGHKVAPPLLAQGYTVASVEYRKVPQTDPAGQTEDAARAVAYLLANAKHFDIDPTKFALLGHSSGAHVVALLGTDPTYLKTAGVDPSRLAADIMLDGVYDVTANLTHYPSKNRLAVFGQDKASWLHLSPTELIGKSTMHPRYCALHEDTNQRFIEQAGLFETAAKKAGAKLDTATVHGLNHGQLVQTFDNPAAAMAPFVLNCLSQSLGH